MKPENIDILVEVKNENTLKIGIPSFSKNLQSFVLSMVYPDIRKMLGSQINESLITEIKYLIKNKIYVMAQSGTIVYDDRFGFWSLNE